MRLAIWLVLAAVQAAPCAAPCAANPELVINEILAAPARDWNGDAAVSSRDDEWVEVYNTTDHEISLAGYRLADTDTSWRYEFTGVLPSHSHLVVFGSDSYAWEKATHHTAVGLALNNAGDTVRLWRFANGDSTQLDAYAYNAVEAGSDRSTGRFPDGADTWRIFDQLDKVPTGSKPEGSNCPPTPTSSNGCTSAIKKTSWGQLRKWFLNEEGPKPVQAQPQAKK